MIKEFLFRVLRLIGALLLIYVCMVFYLALTEREKAYPRAITHTEANKAIAGKAKNVSCTLDDGTILEGWIIGSGNTPTLLYYPDAEEDAAQFLAEIGEMANVTLVTFNYRGSGNNKGTPEEKTFESDANQIAQCAAQVNNTGIAYFAGRGTGAILAAKQGAFATSKNSKFIFIDPIFSLADAISSKYGILYPKFIVRAKLAASSDLLQSIAQRSSIVYDRIQFEFRTNANSVSFVTVRKAYRKGNPLKETLETLTK